LKVFIFKESKSGQFLNKLSATDDYLPALNQSGHSELSNPASQYYQTRPAILMKQDHLLQDTRDGKIGKK